MTMKFVARGRLLKTDEKDPMYGHYYCIDVLAEADDLMSALIYIEFWSRGLGMSGHGYLIEGIGEKRSTPHMNSIMIDISDSEPVFMATPAEDAHAVVDAFKNWLKGERHGNKATQD